MYAVVMVLVWNMVAVVAVNELLVGEVVLDGVNEVDVSEVVVERCISC